MKIKLKDLRDQVIVITGASSGIGLVTARMAGRQGAKVVLASRDEQCLRQLEHEINSSGGQAFAVPCDVTRQDEVYRLAEETLGRFGRFDTWVNDAGGSVFGRILDVPVEEERKLFELNYWGVVYGSRIAAEHLRHSGGALINLGSVASDAAIPLQAAYCASKHAVKAFTDVLRMELEKDGAPVSVTLIKPTAIDTPFFKHAKTYMEAQPIEPSPMYAPDVVAEAILHAAQEPVRDLLVGDLALVQSSMAKYTPRVGDMYGKAMMFEGQKEQRQPEGRDNQIFDRPSGYLRERGGYDRVVFETSPYTKAAMHPVITGALTLGAGLAIVSAIFGRERRTA
jgi:short-subunit dehydrogenase